MKKQILGAALAIFSLAGLAAGQYDGIYKQDGAANTYVTMHTNGSQVIAGIFDTMQSTGVRINSSNGSYTPERLDFWDLLNGTITGNTATLSGQRMFGACTETYQVTFTSTGATGVLTDVSTTAAGTAQGVRCGTFPTRGMTFNLVKVF